jgi:hypothetical protein
MATTKVTVSLSGALLDFDRIADHPEFDLFEAVLPTFLEPLHPLAISRRAGHVDSDSDQIIPIEDTTVPPMALDLLGFIAGRAKLVDNLQDGCGDPFGRNGTPVIELEGKQHLEAPPLAAHRWPSLAP